MRFLFSFSFIIAVSFYCATVNGQKYSGKKKDIDLILANINNFSSYYINGEYNKMANCYTLDGKIFPDKTDIIEGRAAIEKRWTLPQNMKILEHKVRPEEITIVKNTAYDYGYYSGKTKKGNGEESAWKGKYVIVWKKFGKEWKIYLDIWNRIED